MSNVRAALSPEKTITETDFDPDVRYLWVDEDDKPVRSPFYDFGQALTWCKNWEGRYKSLKAKAEIDSKPAWIREEAERALLKHTATGKPPARLVRIVIRAAVASLTPAENEIVRELMR
jgi:hypothetical protein